MMERSSYINFLKNVPAVCAYLATAFLLCFTANCNTSESADFSKLTKEDLVGNLKSNDPFIRKNSILHLMLIKAHDKVEDVAELLNDKDPSVKSIAARYLGECNSVKHTDEIAKLLDDPDTDKSLVLIALDELDAKKYSPKIARLLRVEYDVNTLSKIIKLLSKWHSTESASEIARFLEKPLSLRTTLNERDEIKTACEALGSMKSIEYAKTVATYIWDANVAIQNAAVTALGKMNAIKYKDELIKLQEVIKNEKGITKEIRKNYRTKGIDVEQSIAEILKTW